MFDFSSSLGAASGGLLSIPSAIIQHNLNKDMVDYTASVNYKYGERTANAADIRTRALYNDLYSPQAKIAQLKAAGLNPALMYENGSGISGTTSTQGAQAPSSSVQPLQTKFDIANLALLGSQARLNNANAKRAETESDFVAGAKTAETNANINLLGERAANLVQQTKNAVLQGDYQSLLNEFQEYENYIKSNTLQFDIESAHQYVLNLQQSYHKLGSEISNLNADTKTKDELRDVIKENYIKQNRLLTYQAIESITRSDLNSAMELKTDEERNKLSSERDKIVEETNYIAKYYLVALQHADNESERNRMVEDFNRHLKSLHWSEFGVDTADKIVSQIRGFMELATNLNKNNRRK